MISAIDACVVLLACLKLSSTQSPGDGSSICQNEPFIKPPYPSNIVPLMDSYDYVDLRASEGGPWNTMDVDGDTQTVSVPTVVRYTWVPRCLEPSLHHV